MPGPPGVIRSPNIWEHPRIYEWENECCDPDRVIEQAMAEVHDWAGQRLLDLGCGSGFHLARFAERAASVVGVEPHPPLVRAATRRVARLAEPLRSRIRVQRGSAERIPLPDASVDVVHARWAYFFGPGCEPGLAELRRVLRRGGTAFVIDNDPFRSTFGRWFSAALPYYDGVAVQRFWARQAWTRRELDIRWQMPDRATFEQVIRIEFDPLSADRILREHRGCEVDYAVNLLHHTF